MDPVDSIEEFILYQRQKLEADKCEQRKNYKKRDILSKVKKKKIAQPDPKEPTDAILEVRNVPVPDIQELLPLGGRNAEIDSTSARRTADTKHDKAQHDDDTAMTDAFYAYFTSYNSAPPKKGRAQREDKSKETAPEKFAPTKEQVTATSYNDQRRMEKDRLASKFQTAKPKTILSYQIVEARNQKVQEEEKQRKEEYRNDLQLQIEERKRRLERIRVQERMDDAILNQKIENDIFNEALRIKGGAECSANSDQKSLVPKKDTKPLEVQSNNINVLYEDRPKVRSENMSPNRKDNQVYNFFSNSTARKSPTRTTVTDESHKTVKYDNIITQLEVLRDMFIQLKTQDQNKPNMVGCVLCEAGKLKRCHFCDLDHTDSNSPDMLTDDDSKLNQPEDTSTAEEEQKLDKNIPEEQHTKSGTSNSINYDDIPLPTSWNTPKSNSDPSNKTTPQSKKVQNVEWKWNVPGQRTKVTKPEKVLTQLGAIRKQLQIENLRIED